MKKGWIIKALVGLILCLLVGAGVWFAYKYTNGFNETFKTFYISIDGNDVLTTTSRYTFEAGREYRIDVLYTFDNLNPLSSDDRGYTVAVTLYADDDNNFEFTLDGDPADYSRLSGTDITDCFDLTTYGSYFLFCVPKELGMQDILSGIYPEQEVETPEGVELDTGYYFRLTVYSYNGDNAIYLISRADTPATGLTIDPDRIIFTGTDTAGSSAGDDPDEDTGAESGGTDDGDDTLSEAVQTFMSYVRGASKALNNPLLSMLDHASTAYDQLTDEERALYIVVHYHYAYAIMAGEVGSTGTLSDETRAEVVAILDAADEAFGS